MAISQPGQHGDVRVLAERARSAESLTRGELLQLHSEAIAAKREVDVVLARVAAEVARRSQGDGGEPGLARHEGFGSPQQLIASASGGSTGEADRLMTVGRVLADAEAPRLIPDAPDDSAMEPPPTPRPPRYESLAAAIREGRLSNEVGALIARALDRLVAALPWDAGEVSAWERKVVHKAEGLPVAKVRRLLAFAEAQANPAELERREQRLHAERFAQLCDEPDGALLLTARLDPVSAAPIRAMVDGYVRKAFQERRDAVAAGAAQGEAPTAGQLRADALAWIARHAQGCEASHDGVKTTVVVRLDVKDLEAGCGVAEVDGLATPVSVPAARQLAADADVIPAVLGGDGQVLDWGRRRRLFTRDQRQALVERDGGCAKCHAPPDWCEAHHIRWWGRDRGPTDMDNGVLLCTRCHHDVHRDGWGIEVKGHRVWFTPPRSLDPARTPVLGGRARLRLDE